MSHRPKTDEEVHSIQRINGSIVYSATDLVGYLACGHLTNLERAALEGRVRRPVRHDAELDRIAQRGVQHERRFIDELGTGQTVLDLDGVPLEEAAARTIEAMRAGAEVIYQGALFDGRRQGRPDFLLRIGRPSDLGAWSYEVWDTKLARHPKASAVLQLCVYSELLARVQGVMPERMVLALGGSARETVPFRFADFGAYYRLVKTDFEREISDADPAWPLPTRPDPVEHCEVCRWSEVCTKQLRAEDDLSLVAGISAAQRGQLRERDVVTRTALAYLAPPLDPTLRGGRSSWERLWNQARLQVEGERAGRTLYELLPPPRSKDGLLEPKKGLLGLPEPSEGDLFFDIEGDPFANDDGVDYLFGVIEPRLGDAAGEPRFHTFWSIENDREVTARAERRAFEAFIDLVMDRLERFPDMHIYHYAPYEPTAMKRLMGRYGTREEEVDRLLRGEVFVDLYRVARQGMRASVESYSIKRLEPLYDYAREVDLRDAGSSIAAFETWLELGGDVPDDPDILRRIREYNRDDCVSTRLLRDWLEERRTELEAQLGIDLPRPVAGDGEPEAELSESLKETQELVERLTDDVPGDEREPTQEERARWLLAQLLSWHRRENKSMWWRYFHLLNDLTDEERVEEPDALGGLVPLGLIGEEKHSNVYRFSYPPQEHKITEGSSPKDEHGGGIGTVVGVDDESGVIDIKRGKLQPEPEPTSLIPLEIVSDRELVRSLKDTARWVVENGIDAPGRSRAARDLVLRQRPRFTEPQGDRLLRDGETAAGAARRLVRALDESYLAIQGPPGSGKTTVGAEMVVDLVASGKKVGVTANSHKVIGNLLEKVDERARERGVAVGIGQRPSRDGELTFPGARPIAAAPEAVSALADGTVDVLGATAWQWCRTDTVEAVDYLIVDEAGQMSLANVIAAAPGARNLVLLGDPQQLDQPLKGVHPPGAGRSALAHLIGEQATMPDHLGVFLDGTWRLHPALCAYTSEVFYDARLNPNEGTARRSVAGGGELDGVGIRFIGIPHEGHTTDSEEEADALADLVNGLLAAHPAEVDESGNGTAIDLDGVLIVTPYNAHIRAVRDRLPGANVGTVDKFQGREASIAVYSMATSSAADAPRGMEFLYSLNRLNVATSRARCLAVVVASPELLRVRCRTPRQMRLANALARFVEVAAEGRSRAEGSPTAQP